MSVIIQLLLMAITTVAICIVPLNTFDSSKSLAAKTEYIVVSFATLAVLTVLLFNLVG